MHWVSKKQETNKQKKTTVNSFLNNSVLNCSSYTHNLNFVLFILVNVFFIELVTLTVTDFLQYIRV